MSSTASDSGASGSTSRPSHMDDPGGVTAILVGLVVALRPHVTVELGWSESTVRFAAAVHELVLSPPAQPQTAPQEGLQHPEGRSFYSIDPRHSHPGFDKPGEAFEPGCGDRIRRIGSTLYDLDPAHLTRLGPIDLAYVGAGTVVDHSRILRLLWPRIAEGGVIAYLRPPTAGKTGESAAATGSEPAAIRDTFWTAVQHSHPERSQVLLLGPVDGSPRGGVGLIRKMSHGETTSDPGNFTDELVARGGPPVRFANLGFHTPDRLDDKAARILRLLSDAQTRSVLFAVGGRCNSIDDLEEELGYSRRAIAKSLAKLFEAGALVDDGKNLDTSDTFWSQFLELTTSIPPAPHRAKRIRGQHTVLAAIANQLDPDEWVGEHHVNELCLTVDEDFATLRRELVDRGYLVRSEGRYRRAQ
ncbi:DUF2087 domain-containing protein [Rhodococcus sp. Leaf278]|uniref:DUF2087 domain-containing protein n=1 Tax=Rhodococcus sp. Leaf278 TaxID=1736319 RepID=UPI00138F3642|nr:DUF2087 domain-containing protein [Rhodococcus sp. Leaf278]